MQWTDEGYLLSKSNYSENSIIVEIFTLDHGKCTGIVYGGSSRKQKKNLQIGNKILINWTSKGENRPGYFSVELIEPIIPKFFDDKKRSICIVSAASILKILLPERQLNKKIYNEFEKMLSDINLKEWIVFYIYWELFLIKELGFEINLSKNTKNNFVEVNNKSFKIPYIISNGIPGKILKESVLEALIFNRNLLMENFLIPNKLRFPLSRKILEKYYI